MSRGPMKRLRHPEHVVALLGALLPRWEISARGMLVWCPEKTLLIWTEWEVKRGYAITRIWYQWKVNGTFDLLDITLRGKNLSKRNVSLTRLSNLRQNEMLWNFMQHATVRMITHIFHKVLSYIHQYEKCLGTAYSQQKQLLHWQTAVIKCMRTMLTKLM